MATNELSQEKRDAIVVTQISMATAEALNGEAAEAILANFSNGVHFALTDPDLAKRLAAAAEMIVKGEVHSDNTLIETAIKNIREIDSQFEFANG